MRRLIKLQSSISVLKLLQGSFLKRVSELQSETVGLRSHVLTNLLKKPQVQVSCFDEINTYEFQYHTYLLRITNSDFTATKRKE